MGRDRTLRGTLVNLAVLAATVGVIFGVDRGLLRVYGHPLWTFDPVLHYKHSPGTRLEWPDKYGNKPILINRHGHHDGDFPEKKPEGELRILVLGCSAAHRCTMNRIVRPERGVDFDQRLASRTSSQSEPLVVPVSLKPIRRRHGPPCPSR